MLIRFEKEKNNTFWLHRSYLYILLVGVKAVQR